MVMETVRGSSSGRFTTPRRSRLGRVRFSFGRLDRGRAVYLLSAGGDLAAEWYFSRSRFLYISWFCHRSDAMMLRGLEVFGSGDFSNGDRSCRALFGILSTYVIQLSQTMNY